MLQDEASVSVEDTDDNKTKEAWELDLQEADGQQEYVNNVCGKEMLHLKGKSITRGLVSLEMFFDSSDVVKEP